MFEVKVPRTRHKNKHIQEPKEPFEVKEYIEIKKKANKQIPRTIETLKGIHKVLRDSRIHTRNQVEQGQHEELQEKTDNKSKTLQDAELLIDQESIQKQHNYAKSYLRKINQQGAQERIDISRAPGAQAHYRRISDKEVTQRERESKTAATMGLGTSK